MPRLQSSRLHKRIALVILPLTLVLVILFFTTTTSLKVSDLKVRPKFKKDKGLPPNHWKYPTSGGDIVIKNGSSLKHLPPVPYDERYPTRKALVMASYSKQNMDWLEEMPHGWERYRYVLDDPNPHAGLRVPRNQGREAMAYLTYIIENYYNLPNFTVFHHGHLRAWHQVEPTPMKLTALNLSALAINHYINLRCELNPGCTTDTIINVKNVKKDEKRAQAKLLPKFWDTMFGGDSLFDFGPPPDALSIPCCAQFAVTREAIQAHPLSFWRTYRYPLERDLSEYKDTWGEYATTYYLGICYEKLWHMVFAQKSQHCPDEEYCRNVHFSGAIVCDRYTGKFLQTKSWESIKCINKYQDD